MFRPAHRGAPALNRGVPAAPETTPLHLGPHRRAPAVRPARTGANRGEPARFEREPRCADPEPPCARPEPACAEGEPGCFARTPPRTARTPRCADDLCTEPRRFARFGTENADSCSETGDPCHPNRDSCNGGIAVSTKTLDSCNDFADPCRKTSDLRRKRPIRATQRRFVQLGQRLKTAV